MHPEIDMLTPSSLSEALSILAQEGTVIPIAGGTNVVVGLHEGEYRNQTLMDIGRLHELRGISQDDGYIVLGAGTTLAEVLDSPLVVQHGLPLQQAARVFANPLVRNRATVAGNLVDASPAADTATPLLVLDAELELVSAKGTRRMALDEFMVGVNQTERRPDELVKSIRWQIPGGKSASAFHKLALRKGTACSVISAAVLAQVDDGGRCKKARVALGAVAIRPIRAYAAEKTLQDELLGEEVIERAALLASEAAKPIDDVRSTAAYRKRMAGGLVRRLLTQVSSELR